MNILEMRRKCSCSCEGVNIALIRAKMVDWLSADHVIHRSTSVLLLMHFKEC